MCIKNIQTVDNTVHNASRRFFFSNEEVVSVEQAYNI
jgi:hypothetical protein